MLQPPRAPLSIAIKETNHAHNRSVKVTTVAPHSQTLQGTLFTACPKSNIIAINTDREANMVTKAGYAVIGDLHQVVPAITAEIRKRRGA